MPDYPPTNVRPTDPEEPNGTGVPEGTPTSIRPPGGFLSIEAGLLIAGRYKLVKELGEGGMGAVWMAEQSEPVRRLVAVKLIRTGMDDREFRYRFEAERQALSLMDHPNIAKVFDAGTHQGRPFFVMELVKGTPITKYCDEKRLTPRQRLELFVPVCNAIQHAHQKGIIHRDIKPSNVLVALHDDKPVPKVIDFGVAKATGQPLSDKTMHTLGVVGTPEYMSPEQATENQLDIDTRSDVYSLGVLLYELLTGTTPVKASGLKQKVLLEILRIVREVEAPRPSTYLSTSDTSPGVAAVRGTEPARLTKELRGELDWIALKALEKDRARRYETANGFAADVQRYLAGEPVLAHPPSAVYRMRKFVRKHRGPVIAASLILLALIGGAVGAVYGVIKAGGEKTARVLKEQAENERDRADSARGEAVGAREAEATARLKAETAQLGEERMRRSAEKSRDGELAARLEAEAARDSESKAKAVIEWIEYGRTIQRAYQAYRDNNSNEARSLLSATRPEFRGWEWHYVHRLCHSHYREFPCSREFPFSTQSVSPDGEWFVTPRGDVAVVTDIRFGTQRLVLKGHQGRVISAAFSPDNLIIATSDESLQVRLWNAFTGKQLRVLPLNKQSGRELAFSSDGTRLAVLPGTGNQVPIRTLDVATGREVCQVAATGSRGFAFGPKGKRIVTSEARSVRWGTRLVVAGIWDGDTGEQVLKLERGEPLHPSQGLPPSTSAVAYSPDGARVATASDDGFIRLWDAKSGVEQHAFPFRTRMLWTLAFSPDGTRLVSAGQGDLPRVWDVRTGAELQTLRGVDEQVYSATFFPDGNRVLTVGSKARIWNLQLQSDAIRFRNVSTPDLVPGLPCVAFRNHTLRLALIAGNRPRIWDEDASDPPSSSAEDRNLLAGKLFSPMLAPDGKHVLVSKFDGTLQMWDADSGTERYSFKPGASLLGWLHDGRFLTAAFAGPVYVRDGDTGKEILRLEGHTDHAYAAALSPEGACVITAGMDGMACIWDAKTGAKRVSLRGPPGSPIRWSFSPDGTRVAIAGLDATARIVELKTGEEKLAIRYAGPAQGGVFSSVAFSPDGSRIVTTKNSNRPVVWDATSGLPVLELRSHSPTLSAQFSPDGSRIVTTGFGPGSVRLWDTKVGAELLELSGATGQVMFSPDGTRLLGIGADQIVTIWDSRPLNRESLPVPPPRAVPNSGR